MSTAQGSLRAAAFAKLNLTLHVEGVRDDGYHLLEALTVSVGQPHDTLVLTRDDEPGVRLALSDEPDVVPVPEEGSNLAVRAAQALLDRTGADGGFRIWLRKRIPSGAGLGGGSADAAAVLLAGRALLAAESALEIPTDADLVAMGGELGADVPFCLGGGAAWMRGIGERLDPVALSRPLPVVVAAPTMRLSTPEVFAAWDTLGGPRSERVVPAPPFVSEHLSQLRNDLEPAAEHVEPSVADFRRHLEEVSGLHALMTGSGSAHVVFPPDVREADRLAERLRQELDARVFAGATAGTGVRIAPAGPE
ncbi:MAG: 4-(cytidine 5'-diphospho)-2-C-methyl-D-erythritol kinase [Acidimicrobiia bacterium]